MRYVVGLAGIAVFDEEDFYVAHITVRAADVLVQFFRGGAVRSFPTLDEAKAWLSEQ